MQSFTHREASNLMAQQHNVHDQGIPIQRDVSKMTTEGARIDVTLKELPESPDSHLQLVAHHSALRTFRRHQDQWHFYNYQRVIRLGDGPNK